jgi:hypothetical protein
MGIELLRIRLRSVAERILRWNHVERERKSKSLGGSLQLLNGVERDNPIFRNHDPRVVTRFNRAY